MTRIYLADADFKALKESTGRTVEQMKAENYWPESEKAQRGSKSIKSAPKEVQKAYKLMKETQRNLPAFEHNGNDYNIIVTVKKIKAQK